VCKEPTSKGRVLPPQGWTRAQGSQLLALAQLGPSTCRQDRSFKTDHSRQILAMDTGRHHARWRVQQLAAASGRRTPVQHRQTHAQTLAHTQSQQARKVAQQPTHGCPGGHPQSWAVSFGSRARTLTAVVTQPSRLQQVMLGQIKNLAYTPASDAVVCPKETARCQHCRHLRGRHRQAGQVKRAACACWKQGLCWQREAQRLHRAATGHHGAQQLLTNAPPPPQPPTAEPSAVRRPDVCKHRGRRQTTHPGSAPAG
jgi:hypothetical protein